MKCIVVCAHALFREGFCNLFGQLAEGTEVFGAEGVAEAQRLLREEEGVRLVFFHLPRGESGWQELEALVGVAGQVPVVVTSDFASDDEIRRAISLGARGCVSTEHTWVTVVTVIKRVLEGEIVSPSLRCRVSREEVVQPPRVAGGGGEEGAGRDAATASQAPLRVHLTPRQREVLEEIRRGRSNKEIARRLNLAEGTVKIHCVAIFRELGVTNRTQAAIVAERILAGEASPATS